jgi:hypothetical protein
MAQIEYCDEDVKGPSWHPPLEPECANRDDDWIDQYFLPLWAYPKQSAVEQEFQQLASRWKRETALDGSLQQIVMHEDYQRIMAMGPDVIRLILRDLAVKPAHWFWALHNLVREGEDPAEGTTTIEAARQAWLKWGRDNDFL